MRQGEHLLAKVLIISVSHGRLDVAPAGIPVMRQAAWRLAKLQETGKAFSAGMEGVFTCASSSYSSFRIW